jgi:hypothetical protein
MKKSSFVFVILLLALQLLGLNAFGQKHDYIWVYGSQNLPNDPLSSKFGGAYIDFNQSPPVSVSINRKLNFNLNAGACCDSLGNLQFYTNGIEIHNYMDELIENGDSINYDSVFWEAGKKNGYSEIIGPIALPYPGHQNQYFLFHTAWRYELDSSYSRNAYFYYTVIDMTANAGRGKVISKNNVLLERDLGWFAACKHGNGRDWWITSFQRSKPKQISFLLTSEGLSNPIEQPIALGTGFPDHEGTGKSCFSPNGKFYIRHDDQNGIRIFDFDRCTGVFSNQRILQYPGSVYTWSASFSDDSHFLYLANRTLVYAIDMYNINNIQYMDTVGIFNRSYCDYPFSTRMYLTQEGPDGKIYCSAREFSLCMSTIEKPKLISPACEVAYGGFELSRWNDNTICHFPHYRLGEYEGSPCDTLNTQKPDDGFYKSVYNASDEAEAQKDPEADFILIPIGNTATPEAIEEKRRYGDMNRIMHERLMEGEAAIRRPLTQDHINANNNKDQHDEK